MIIVLWVAAWPPLFAATMTAIRKRKFWSTDFWESWFWGGFGATISAVMDTGLVAIAIAVANLVLGAVMWWLSRRKRKRSAKLVGAKSRALLAAVVARMREAAKPRPVFRPVPGGARG